MEVEQRCDFQVRNEPEVDDPAAEGPDLGNFRQITAVVSEPADGADDELVNPFLPTLLYDPHLVEDIVVRRVNAKFHEQNGLCHCLILLESMPSAPDRVISAAMSLFLVMDPLVNSASSCIIIFFACGLGPYLRTRG